MKKKEAPERNVYLDVQIQCQIMEVKNFIKLCESAAKKDDGDIDEFEAKILKSVGKASNKYLSTLNKLLE